MAFLTAMLVVALTPQVADAAREGLIRWVVDAEKTPYFKAYCLAVDSRQATLPPTREEQARQVMGGRAQDVVPTLLRQVQDLPHRIVPESSCTTITDRGDVEVVERGRRGPALRIVIGPLDVVASDRVRMVVFTSSGSLTDTVMLYELTTLRGRWVVVGRKMLFQA